MEENQDSVAAEKQPIPMGSYLSDDDLPKELSRLRLLAQSQKVLCRSKSLPLLARQQPSKLAPHMLQDKLHKRSLLNLTMTRANNFAQSIYPLLKDVHKLWLERQEQLECMEALQAIRDRTWISSCKIAPDTSTLVAWHQQLQTFMEKLEGEYKTLLEEEGLEVLDEETQLCTELDYTDEAQIHESLTFGTRFRSIELFITVKEECDEVSIESTIPLEGCKEGFEKCYSLALPIDLVIRRWVWEAIKEQLINGDTTMPK